MMLSKYSIILSLTLLFIGCHEAETYTDEPGDLDGVQMMEYQRMFSEASRYIIDTSVDSDFSNGMGPICFDLIRRRLIYSQVILLDKKLRMDTIRGYNKDNEIHFIPETLNGINITRIDDRVLVSQYLLGKSDDGKYPHVFFIQNVYHKKDSTCIAETYFAVPNCNPYSVFSGMPKKVNFEDIAFRYTMLNGRVGSDSLKRLLDIAHQ